jgi:hypothetical protein
MRTGIVTTLSLLAAACSSIGPPVKGPHQLDYNQLQEANRWSVQWVQDEAAHNAVIRQHTVFPHHFVDGSPQLNSHGARDLAVLGRHLARYQGQVNVRQGVADAALYGARVEAVRSALEQHGVAAATLPIGDAPPGGDGATADRVLLVLQKEKQESGSRGSTSKAAGNTATE